jgi:hypothetical protein
MFNYVKGLENIRKMLMGFLSNGIDVTKLEPMDRVIESAKIDQVKILNSYQPLAVQRTLFGAMRNISNVVEVMKEKVRIARETHENPTTLELSLEIIEHLSTIAPYVDDFIIEGKIREMSRLNELSRILYRKANRLGFYQDVETQLKQARISRDETQAFLERLSENIGLEVETLDESSE